MMLTAQYWIPYSLEQSLSPDELHVFRLDLDQVSVAHFPIKTILASGEIARASQFHFELDRKRFIARRILLRLILSRFLEVEPGRLEFGHNPFGKPFLKQPADRAINFNVAHSERFALFAISQAGPLGVDIERVRPDSDYQEIAERYFSTEERSAILASSEKESPEVFYKLWTRKEAYIKGRGMGLSMPLESFDTSQEKGGVVSPLEEMDEKTIGCAWVVLDLPPIQGFEAALAVEDARQMVNTWDWTEVVSEMRVDWVSQDRG